MSPKEFADFFLEFERRNKMFSVKINNVHIWHYIRFEIYFNLLRKLGMADVMLSVSRNEQTQTTWRDIFREKIMCNQFFARKRDALIIAGGRKYKYGKNYKCIYTSLLDEFLENSHYVLDSKSMENRFVRQKSRNILYFDLERYKKKKKLRICYETASKAEVNSLIIDKIEKYFDICFDLEYKKRLFNTVTDCINNRKYLISYYNYILKKVQPKIILLVCYYSFENMVLCEVAYKKKIPVVELQHGAIGYTAVQYNFYRKVNFPWFPDYFFSFGSFVKKKARFPIDDKRIIPVGYPELEQNYNLYKGSKGDKETILFISEGDAEIAKYVNAVAKKLNPDKYHVMFQLHPKEYFDWKTNIGKCLSEENIEVVGSFEHTIHESLAKADWVIGNYSTVLYEAQMFDVKVVVLKYGLYMTVEELYEYGCALLVDSPQQLIAEIETDSFVPNKEVTVFERNSLRNMQKNINRIIKEHQKA